MPNIFALILDSPREISNGKAAGMDGLSVESLKYANYILSVLLSICFTCMFKHCYLPIGMLNSVIVPLVKNKNGDLSDRNNYRPIALSSTVSKIFENVIINRLEEYLWTSDNQFRYKSGHSYDLCVSYPFDKCFISIVNTLFCIMYSVCLCSWWWDVHMCIFCK